MHERLMQLRDKVFGRQRIIFGKVPEEMDVPLQIDKDLYFEAKFDTETLLTMMKRIQMLWEDADESRGGMEERGNQCRKNPEKKRIVVEKDEVQISLPCIL